MNTIREIQKINEQELERGIAGTPASWHSKYSKSAWVYLGNLDQELSEGDIICVMSQYGEIEDLHLVREQETGKSKGFAFCKYEDARSCVLAVDNLIGIQLCGRSLRIDHVENYKLPKHLLEKEEEAATGPGLAYKDEELANEYNLQKGQDLFAPVQDSSRMAKEDDSSDAKRQRKEERRQKRLAKEEKKAKKREKERRREEKEEKKRLKRARRYDDDESDDAERSKKRKKHRKSEKEQRSRSESG